MKGGITDMSFREDTPSTAMFGLINRGLRKLQAKALKNILPEQEAGKAVGFNVKRMEDQTITLQNTIRFVYTVECQGDGFLHVISSQLMQQKGPKYQVQCTALVMLLLTQQLDEAGMNQEDVEFDIEESETGTHYVCMLLDPSQHQQFADKAQEAA
jgi:hypothetical protein